MFRGASSCPASSTSPSAASRRALAPSQRSEAPVRSRRHQCGRPARSAGARAELRQAITEVRCWIATSATSAR
eukprot:4641628-Alexandrium_andersonii.AAC.1